MLPRAVTKRWTDGLHTTVGPAAIYWRDRDTISGNYHVVAKLTQNSFVPVGLGPIGVAVIFGVDELMDMGRTCVNVIGNCLATVVVARWENEFDDNRACVFGTPAEAELDLKSGEIAFGDVAARGD